MVSVWLEGKGRGQQLGVTMYSSHWLCSAPPSDHLQRVEAGSRREAVGNAEIHERNCTRASRVNALYSTHQMPASASTTGGFFLQSADPTAEAGAQANTGASEALAPSRLSPVQLTRLRSHLDAKILSVQRRYSKRFHRQEDSNAPLDDKPLATLSEFIDACRDDLLPIIFRIDPVGAQQTSTVVAYAMSVTELITQGVMGYPSLQERRKEAGQDEGLRNAADVSPLFKLLHVVSVLDALWSALLLGRSVSYPLASERAHLQLVYNHPSRPSDCPRPSSIKDTSTLLGSLGSKTCTVTDRVRLRNLLLTRKVELEDWLGGIAGVTIERRDEAAKESRKRRRHEDDAEPEVQRAEEPASQKARLDEVQEEEDDEPELEDVAVSEDDIAEGHVGDDDVPHDEDTYPKTEEQERYDALFDRKLDPDSDLGEESDADAEPETSPSAGDSAHQEPAPDISPAVAAQDELEGPHAEDEAPTSMRLPTDSLQLQTLTSKFFARSFSVMERLFGGE